MLQVATLLRNGATEDKFRKSLKFQRAKKGVTQ
jgi:hypothetical protein